MLNQRIKGLAFFGSVFNACGCKNTNYDDLKALAESKSCAVSTKTVTYAPKEGNPKPRYYETADSTLNSMGLPNCGFFEMGIRINHLKGITDKPIFASVRFDNIENIREMVDYLEKFGADVIEINLSTPNLLGKPQLCYDVDKCNEILREAEKHISVKTAIKVSPFLDGNQQMDFIEMINKRNVDFIMAINSAGNCLMIDPYSEEIVIKPKYGGYGGKGIKPIALGNIRRYYENSRKTIIGCGGIFNGIDAFEHILAGASLVNVGSSFLIDGLDIFSTINMELEEILTKHNYKHISEAIGQAKTI